MKPGRLLCRAVLASAMILTSWPAPALATWPHDVFTNVSIYGARDYRNSPRACPDGAGGAFVCWQDFERTPSCHCVIWADVVFRHVSRDGVPTGPGLLLSQAGETSGHTIVSDGQAGALIAWRDGVERIEPGIFVQRIGASGSPLWTEGGVRVTSDTAHIGSLPVLVADGQGGALAAWVESRDDFGTTFPRVYVQRVGADGVIRWSAGGRPVAESQWEMRNPSLTGSPDGGAIVAWEDLRNGDPDVYAQKLEPLWGGIAWPGGYDDEPDWEGVFVGGQTGSAQSKPRAVSDGAGGACIVWEDERNGNLDLYAQRMSNIGYPAWVSGGRSVTTAAGAQQDFTIDSDGSGGVVVAWRDFRNPGDPDVFAQRVDAGGRALWDADGVAMSRAVGEPTGLQAETDGSGGLIVSWMDRRLGGLDVWAQRVSADGTLRWEPDGAAVSLAAGDQFNASLTADGRGGAIVVWDDARSDYSREIYGQRIDRSGDLGDPAPAIASVLDVPFDQGGKVRVSWYASYLDADPLYPVATYWVWRAVPEAAALAAIRRGAILIDGEEQAALLRLEGSNVILRSPGSHEPVFWEFFGAQAATADTGYSMLVTTTSDSMPEGNPPTFFRVQARHRDGLTFWTSMTASGYSVDNLAPPIPAPFAADYGPESTALHWGASPAPDLREFHLYRGLTPDFVPGPANLLAATRDTGYVDPVRTAYVYQLAAVDLHGNPSRYALVTPDGLVSVQAALASIEGAPDRIRVAWYAPANPGLAATVYRRTEGSEWVSLGVIVADARGYLRYEDTGVETGRRYGYRLGIADGHGEVFVGEAWAAAGRPVFALEGVRPNPAVGSDLTVFFSLPEAGRAMLELVDIDGRRLASRDVGSMGPGRHSLSFREGGRIPPGVYLLRMTQGGRSLTRRAAVLR